MNYIVVDKVKTAWTYWERILSWRIVNSKLCTMSCRRIGKIRHETF